MPVKKDFEVFSIQSLLDFFLVVPVIPENLNSGLCPGFTKNQEFYPKIGGNKKDYSYDETNGKNVS